MDRRDFLKKAAGVGIAAGYTLASVNFSNLMAASQASPAAYDLVAVKGGEPELMFDKAIGSMGGME
jgi:hypothetical protein